jgi:hypothetical protein
MTVCSKELVIITFTPELFMLRHTFLMLPDGLDQKLILMRQQKKIILRT